MDILCLYNNNVHKSKYQDIYSLFSYLKKPILKVHSKSSKCIITMSTITPAQTTTQLLVFNTQTSFNSTLPQKLIDLSMLLQAKSKIPVSSSGGIGQIKYIDKRTLIAAHQPKRPIWTESHAYIRGSRTNTDQLRILSTELNMIRASKITRSLKPRRSFLSKRQDVFVWGKPSPLRLSE